MSANERSGPILLICNTRTGSTAFGSALEASNQGIAFAGEVFHPQGLFTKWLRENKITALSFFTNKQQVLKDFLSDCNASYTDKLLVCDVKYHDLYGLMPTPALYDFPPALLSALRELDGRVLHLKRKSRFDSAISQFVAGTSKVHHVRIGEQLPNFTTKLGKLVIDPAPLARQIQHRVYHELITGKQILNSRCQCLEIYYEEIFGDKITETLASLGRFLGCSIRFDRIVHQKIGEMYGDIIQDYESLREKLREWENTNWPVSLLG